MFWTLTSFSSHCAISLTTPYEVYNHSINMFEDRSQAPSVRGAHPICLLALAASLGQLWDVAVQIFDVQRACRACPSDRTPLRFCVNSVARIVQMH
eukprot:1887683-Amphidinium_carterae.1